MFQAHRSLSLSVLSKEVVGASADAADDALEGEATDVLAEASGGLTEAQEVGTETGDVRGGHRGAGERAGGATNVGAENADTGSVDVDETAVVGEGSDAVRAVGGGDSADGGLRSGGDGAGIDGDTEDVTVTSGNGDEDASVNESSSGVVGGLGEATSKGHVHDDTVGAVASGRVRKSELETTNDGVAVSCQSLEL